MPCFDRCLGRRSRCLLGVVDHDDPTVGRIGGVFIPGFGGVREHRLLVLADDSAPGGSEDHHPQIVRFDGQHVLVQPELPQ
jgi:hypothetical protein